MKLIKEQGVTFTNMTPRDFLDMVEAHINGDNEKFRRQSLVEFNNIKLWMA